MKWGLKIEGIVSIFRGFTAEGGNWRDSNSGELSWFGIVRGVGLRLGRTKNMGVAKEKRKAGKVV